MPATLARAQPPPGEDVRWLLDILRSVQLEQFFARVRDELQVTRLDHFEFVQPEDLEKVGMARPAARRLLDLVRRKRRKMLVGRLLPAPLQQRFVGGTIRRAQMAAERADAAAAADSQDGLPALHALTCLIHDKDVTLLGEFCVLCWSLRMPLSQRQEESVLVLHILT